MSTENSLILIQYTAAYFYRFIIQCVLKCFISFMLGQWGASVLRFSNIHTTSHRTNESTLYSSYSTNSRGTSSQPQLHQQQFLLHLSYRSPIANPHCSWDWAVHVARLTQGHGLTRCLISTSREEDTVQFM